MKETQSATSHPGAFRETFYAESAADLFLVVLRVVDEEDAVLPPVGLGGLLEGHAHVHPALRLPVSPPAQRTFTHPHRLQEAAVGVNTDVRNEMRYDTNAH